MSSEKTTMGINKVVSFEEAAKEKGQKEPVFSQGLYHWVMFILSTRVRENLKIDFESFVILQVVVSHSLYQINKTGTKTFSELEDQMTRITENKRIKHSNTLWKAFRQLTPWETWGDGGGFSCSSWKKS